MAGVQQRGTTTGKNNMAFFRGGRKRGNPALEEKRTRQGEKETHSLMLWERKSEGNATIKIPRCESRLAK